MKRWLIMIVVAVLLVGTGLWWLALNEQEVASGFATQAATTRTVPESTKSETPIVGVDHFMRNVNRYEGAVRVQGIVSAADANSNMLALIDVSEFQACQTTTCAQLILPVRWSKDMPKIAETVVVTGSVQESGGKRILAASDVERVGPKPKLNR